MNHQPTNYQWADNTTTAFNLPWTIAQATPDYTLPPGLTATVGTQTHKATYTPSDQANYKVLTDIDVSITVKAAGTDPIRNT